MGDLNYRVDMPDDILNAWVQEGKYAQILEKDQASCDTARASRGDKDIR